MAIEPEPKFNRELFNQLCERNKLDTDAKRANALGVEWTTVYRIRTGERGPGLRFANACRRLFGTRAHSRLFPLAETEETTDARS